MTKGWLAALALAGAACLTQCSKADAVPDVAPVPTYTMLIVVDQFGYLPVSEKIAIIRQPVVGYYTVADVSIERTYEVAEAATGKVVLSGAAVPWRGGTVHEGSGDKVWHFDFSSVGKPGSYVIRSADGRDQTGAFDIAPDVYNGVLREAFRTFYYQRAGYAKDAPYADARWADRASHLGPGQDTEARAFDAKSDASTARDLRGGWYDAGDYNKYTNWTAEYCRTLLLSFSENSHAWGDDFGIPESGNGISDLLDEVNWGLDWLKRMQNEDGSVLSVMGLATGSPPSAATGPSYYGPASTSATLSTAGAFAFAAMIYGNSPAPGHLAYADDLKARALKAWDWAEANPDVTFYNNDARDSSEGLAAGQQEVDEGFRADKRLAAAVYLYALTGEDRFQDYVESALPKTTLFVERRIDEYRLEAQDAALVYSHLPGADSTMRGQIQFAHAAALSQLRGDAAVTNRDDAYLAPVSAMHWGSNNVKARRGSIVLDTLALGPNLEETARAQAEASHYLHYLHGANPMGKVYLSNMAAFGAEDSVGEMYHSWFTDGSAKWDSVSGSTYGPAPGFLVGGPNPYYEWDACCPNSCGGGKTACTSAPLSPPFGQPDLKSYRDFNAGWPLNSWQVTENSNGYQVAYLRLLANFVE